MFGFQPKDHRFASKAIHSGQDPKKWKSLAVIPPITLSSTFCVEEPTKFLEKSTYGYGRFGHPGRDVLEKCIASLDKAESAVTFSSGMASVDAICKLLKAGDHIISMDDIYGGTNTYFRQMATSMSLEVSFVDLTDPKNAVTALKPNTKLVWLESPTNPTLKVIDIRTISNLVHQQEGVLVAVDNTFLSSYFQCPLELGADLSFQSLTKYMNGHEDVIMGAVSTNDPKLADKLRFIQRTAGAIPSPFDCYLVNRSLKTLPLRMEQHQKNSNAVAKFLEASPYVEKVLYPASPNHPQYEIIKRQQSGYSGMISFYIKGDLETSRKFLKSLKMFHVAVSLGGYSSMAQLPYEMTHRWIPEEEKVSYGITENLIRISLGLEDTEDIIEDIKQALATACSVGNKVNNGLKAKRSVSMRDISGPNAKSLEYLYQNYKDQIVFDLIKTFESRISKLREDGA